MNPFANRTATGGKRPFAGKPRIISAGAQLVAPDQPRAVARPGGSPKGPPQTIQDDLARVLYLPSSSLDARCQDKAYIQALLHPMAPADFALRPIQSDAIWSYEQEGGLLAPMGCGHGKTLVGLACAKIAHRRRGHRTVVLLVPPEVIDQLRTVDLPKARRCLDLDDTIFTVVQGSADRRTQAASSGLPGVYIMSYSTISTQSGFDTLLAIGATAYILDEAHKLARPNTARTKRWMSAVAKIEQTLPEGHPGIDVVAMSGTITKKKIADYAHLARAALRERSPLPITPAGVDEWGLILDADSYTGSLTSTIARQLIQWALDHGAKIGRQDMQLTVREIAREAHQHRLRTAPGVVATSDVSVECSLVLSWREPRMPLDTVDGVRLKNLMEQVVSADTTPDGDEIDWAMHRFKWLWELTGGFYNSLTWPTVDDLMAKGHPQDGAADLIYRAKLHHGLRQNYHKLLRQFLSGRHVPHCDTPLLVGSWCSRIIEKGAENTPKLPPELLDAWKASKEADDEALPTRVSRPVRVCDYRIKEAVEWAKEFKEGIMWFHHPEVGQWVCEYLTKAGIKHTYAPAGENAKAFTPGLVVASYAHGTGKNLQHQNQQCFVELRREADTMEQTLSRTHRQGQEADEVTGHLLIANGFDLAMFNATLANADYMQSTTGMTQKLCYATYNPIIPPTNPRLFLKLGIIDTLPATVNVDAFDQITDNAVAASIFRPAAYHRSDT